MGALWSLASPSQLILASLALGLLLLLLRRGPRSARLLLWFGATGLLVFGLLPTSIYLANVLETRFPQPALPSRVDGIVLLAGAERPAASEAYGRPQVGRWGGRYLTLLELAHRYPEARIVYSGGARKQAGKGPLETQSAAAERMLRDVGVDPRRTTFDESSTDTCSSGRNARVVARPREGEVWVLVTSALHMPRSVACFRAGGWSDIVPQPAGYASVAGGRNLGSVQVAANLELLDDATHEWLGLLFYRVTGRTNELLPGP